MDRRNAGELGDPLKRPRGSVIDPFRPLLQEWVAESGGKVRGDVAYRRLARMEYRGSERTVRRALKEIKRAWRKDNRRVYRPWLPEPGKWAWVTTGRTGRRLTAPGPTCSARTCPSRATGW